MPSIPSAIADLRREIRRLEGIGRAAGGEILPFGMDAVDTALPEGGLARGALHEMRGEAGPLSGFAAFLMGRAAAGGRPLLWIDAAGDLYLPGLQAYGLSADNLILASGIAGDKATLWALEEALATPALGAVAASLEKPGFTALRRLSLTARETGTTAFLMRRTGAIGTSPAVSRWHVAPAPSLGTGLPGVGAPAWRLTLEKHQGGLEDLSFLMYRTAEGWTAHAETGLPSLPLTAAAG